MKLSNIFHLLLAGAFAAGVSSCIDEVKYTPAEDVPMAEVYFSTGNPTQESLEEGQTSFTVLLGRANAGAEQTVTVHHTVASDSTGLDIDGVFTIPESVTFAEGEGTALLEVTYDEAQLIKKVSYNFTFSLDGINDTPYYLGKLDVACTYNPWETLGTGIYTDAIVGSVFDFSSYGWPFTYNVTVQEHPDIKGFYRLLNPYAPGTYPLTFQPDYGNKDYYVYIHAEDPEKVYVETSNIGLCVNSQYGRMIIASESYIQMEEGATDGLKFGTLEKGNIVIPEEQILIAMELYSNGQWVESNAVDFVLVLPGFKPISDWEEVGMCDFTDGFNGPFRKTPVNGNKYKVLVEHNTKTPSLYRIVDPFGAESGYPSSSTATPSEYITFNVANENCVVLTDTIATNFTKLGQGTFMVTTEANYQIEENGMSMEELVEVGIGGTFKDNVITIPGDQILGWYKLKPENIVRQTEPYTDVVLDLSAPEPWEPASRKAPANIDVSKMNLRLRK